MKGATMQYRRTASEELHGLTLLDGDRDFGVIAGVIGQPVRGYGAGP